MSGPKVKVVYIAGTGRTGSTLVARVLGQLPKMVAIGEVRHLFRQGLLTLPPEIRCGCGQAFSLCPFWRDVRERLERRVEDLPAELAFAQTSAPDRIRDVPWFFSPLRSRRFSDRLRRYRHLLLSLYRSVLDSTGAEVVIDESKHLAPLYLLAQCEDVELYVLHLVRDARGVAYSWSKQLRRPEFKDEDRYMYRYSVLRTSGSWLYRNCGAEFVRSFGTPYARIRYENVIEHPRAVLLDALGALGLPTDGLEALGRDRVFLGEDHIPAGNPSRFQRGETLLRLDDAWMRELSAGQRRLVTGLTWPLLARYGYLGSSPVRWQP
ncbi:MAG TPA: sulfotransferase [Thermoanaerobaculia bacterium]|nr:sulfotransferase [Thermoanaerobaculia bacterium]